MPDALLGLLMALEMSLVLGSKYFQIPAADALVPAGVSNTKSIGALMFTDYVFPFELASLILLVGMIAAMLGVCAAAVAQGPETVKVGKVEYKKLGSREATEKRMLQLLNPSQAHWGDWYMLTPFPYDPKGPKLADAAPP